MFRIAKQNRIFQDVLEQIEQVILSGRLKPGDKLPSERELREAMDISRPTLREALRVLEQKGLVEVRVGVKGGAYVKAVGVDQITGGLDLLIRQQKVSLGHLYEFREGVEGTAAGLATERAQQEDLMEFEAAVAEAVQGLEADPDNWVGFYEIESRLHMIVARMSGNPIFEWVLGAIHTGVHTYAHLLPRREWELRQNLQDWQAILEAMKNREVVKVQILTTAHAARFNTYVKEASRKLGQQLSNIMLDI